MGPGILIKTLGYIALSASASPGTSAPLIYTETPRYEPNAPQRFPAGAGLQLLTNGSKRLIVPSFAASADAAVSFDGKRVLFSGKQKSADPWQIWEVPLAGGDVRRMATDPADLIAPFYLPDDRIVYSRRTPSGSQLVALSLQDGATVQLTYGPGNRIASTVLRDGRILFTSGPELYTVYSDGSGVQSYRCDHGPERRGAAELASGDILFETGGRLARFTSARAVQLALPLPQGEFAGPVAEISPSAWIVSFRPAPTAPYGLYRWQPAAAALEKLIVAAGQAVQPVLAQPHPAPKRHPSSLGNRQGANLLCLNVYTSKLTIPAGSVAKVRVWSLTAAGSPALLGEAPVEKDGSFYVNPPSETPIRFELIDRSGKVAAAEKGWFWARRGEQRICIGCHAGPERAPENAVPQVLLRSTDPTRMTTHGGTR